MIENQYSIGKFAAINKITPRMLRHYDKIGLLKPIAVLDNGYRAYTSAQIQAVSRIRRYQSCSFSLAEVKKLLDADDAAVQQAAKAKLAELGVQEKNQQLIREQLQSLAQNSAQSFSNHYDISYTQQSAQMLFSCAVPIAEAEIEAAIEGLYHALDMLGAAADGLLLLLLDLEEASTCRVAVPTVEPLVCEGYECVTLDAGWYLSTVHHGDYYSIGIAYDRLLLYAKEKGYRIKPPFLERYFLDEGNSTSSAKYATQILIALTP